MSKSPDTYHRVGAYAFREIKVKGSRFIAEVWPVSGESDALEQVEGVRKREYNATHHCWAYRLGPAGDTFRYQDDGEPSGTAGRPVYRQIEGRGLTNTLAVVTRYFGGTKLGTGGLIRAYGDAASAVLEAGGSAEEILCDRFLLRFSYIDTSPAMHTIESFGGAIERSGYSDETELLVAVRRSLGPAFEAGFVENLGGRGSVDRV
jgi:uncharacterized YigZ family protein